jgi:hypothetical protein
LCPPSVETHPPVRKTTRPKSPIVRKGVRRCVISAVLKNLPVFAIGRRTTWEVGASRSLLRRSRGRPHTRSAVSETSYQSASVNLLSVIGLSGRWRTTEIEVLLASVENRVGLGIPLLSSHQTVQGGVDRQVELSADSVAQTLARHDYFRKCRTNTDTRQEQDSFFLF